MHRRVQTVSLIAGCLLLASDHILADVPLVIDGKPRAVIVVPQAGPERAWKQAATELVYHVEKASGAKLQIVSEDAIPDEPEGRIYLGNCKAARQAGIDISKLPPEACVLKTQGNAVFVAGMTMDRSYDKYLATVYGVYELLEEHLGVRWLWPGELGEFVPQSDRIVIADTNKTVQPHFVMRFVRTSQDWHKGRPAEGRWLGRHRQGWSQYLYPKHAFRGWWKAYGEQHPEYFALVDGKREPTGLDWEVGMCLSEPRFWDQIIDDWQKEPDRSPGVRAFLDLSENDGGLPCTCEKCVAWAPADKLSDRFARFWLAVQEKARKIDPNVEILTFAYSTYHRPPLETKLNDGIIISMVSDLPWKATPEAIAEARETWAAWEATGTRLFLRPNYFLQGYCMPHIFAGIFGDEFRFANDHGNIATDFDSLTGMYATQGPNLYLLGRRHVKPFADTDDLLAEYYGGFGPAADHVRKYFEYWQQISLQIARQDKGASWPYWPKKIHDMYTADQFARGGQLLKIAADACGDDELCRARVAFLDKGLTHARMCFETAQVIFSEEDSGSQAGDDPLSAMARLLAYRKTIEDEYVVNLAYCRWSESSSGWPWGLFDELIDKQIIAALPLRWKLKWDPQEVGRARHWFDPQLDVSRWLTVRTDRAWEEQEVGRQWKTEHGKDYNGLAWYRTSFALPPEAADRPLYLLFGAVDESATVWLNGELIGERPHINSDDWFTPFEMDISKHADFDRANELVVLVEDRTGHGGVWKPVFVVTH